MAKRYSGSLQISVIYDDRGHYRTSVSSGGKLLWRGTVNPAPSGFGPGVAYDSPQAYDEVASSVIAFADDEVGGIADEAEYDEDMTGYLIKRSQGPRVKRSQGASKTSSSHARKKIDPHEAKQRLEAAGIDFSRDFHTLPSREVDLVLGAARTAGYRKSKGAPGSTARMYFQYLSRLGTNNPGGGGLKREATVVVRKLGTRWQPVNSGGHVVRGDVYNADGAGYSTRESAHEAATMLRKLGGHGY